MPYLLLPTEYLIPTNDNNNDDNKADLLFLARPTGHSQRDYCLPGTEIDIVESGDASAASTAEKVDVRSPSWADVMDPETRL
jgi:hypothetical protein